MIMMKTGAIYSIYYSNYHLNQKVYAFVLYGGPMSDKVHALNLGAIQLTLIDRYKLLRTIKQLISIPESSKYDGATLYQILKRYNPNEIRKCYRTYKHAHIAASSLINFGLNKESDFTPLELSMQNKPLFAQASADYLVKLMNMYTGRAVAQNQIKDSLATDKTAGVSGAGADSTQQGSATGMKTDSAEPDKAFVKQDTSTTVKPDTSTTVRPTTKPDVYTPKTNTGTTNQTKSNTGTTPPPNTGTTKKGGNGNNNGGGGIKGMY